MEQIRETLLEIFEKKGFKREDVLDAGHLQKDLPMDSLDVVIVMCEAEKQCNVQIQNDEAYFLTAGPFERLVRNLYHRKMESTQN